MNNTYNVFTIYIFTTKFSNCIINLSLIIKYSLKNDKTKKYAIETINLLNNMHYL